MDGCVGGWVDTHHQMSAAPGTAHQPLEKLLAQQINPAYTLPGTQITLPYELSYLTLKASDHQGGDLSPEKCLRVARNRGRKSTGKSRAGGCILLDNSHTLLLLGLRLRKPCLSVVQSEISFCETDFPQALVRLRGSDSVEVQLRLSICFSAQSCMSAWLSLHFHVSKQRAPSQRL